MMSLLEYTHSNKIKVLLVISFSFLNANRGGAVGERQRSR